MPNAQNANSVALTGNGTQLGASQTDAPISKQFRITAGGARSSRVDIYVGRVTVAAAVSAKVQHSSGYNVWNDGKTVSITASTNKSISAVSTSGDTLTATSHGFTANQAVALYSSALMPAPLQAGRPYFVIVVDANTIQLAESVDGPAIDITTAGSGTITASLVRVFTITHQETVTGDQSHTPLRSLGRIVATTGAGDDLQVCDAVVLLDD